MLRAACCVLRAGVSAPRGARHVALLPVAILSLVLLAGLAALAPEDEGALTATLTVAPDGSGDFNGTDQVPFQAAVDRAAKAGGGVILVRPGAYTFTAPVRLVSVRGITLRGQRGAVVRLPRLLHTTTTAAAAMGERSLAVADAGPFRQGMRLRVYAPGRVDSFSGRQVGEFEVALTGAADGRLELAAPLAYAVPERTRVHLVANLFDIRGACEDLSFEHLALEGGRHPNDPQVSGHAQLCAIFAHGDYDYARGPTGPPIKRLSIRDCTIRGFHGRGVAMYAVAGGLVERCRIEETHDEAVDFDHFSKGCRAVDNTILRCGVGVELNDAAACRVARNRFEACGTGVNLWRWCPHDDVNVANVVVSNEFHQTRGDVVVVVRARTQRNFVRANRIVGGATGILLDGTANAAAGNRVAGTHGPSILVAGEGCTAAGNHLDRPAGALRVTGNRNRIWDNLPAGVPVRDEGRENQVRAAEAGPPDLTLVQMGDTHVTLRADAPQGARRLDKSRDILENAVAAISQMVRPDLVLHTGDMINWGDERPALDAVRGLLSRLRCPWYPVLGNHDAPPDVFARVMRPRTYTAPGRKGVRLVVLGTYRGKVEPELLEWLRAEIARHPTERLIVATHHPLYLQGAGYHLVADDAAAILDILRPAENVLAILSGHDHAFSAVVQEGRLAVIGPAMVQEPCRFLRIEVYPTRIRVTPFRLADPEGFLAGTAPGTYVSDDDACVSVAVRRTPKLEVLAPPPPPGLEPFVGEVRDDFQVEGLAAWDVAPAALWEVRAEGENRVLRLNQPPNDAPTVLAGMKAVALLKEKAFEHFELQCHARLATGAGNEDLALVFNHTGPGEFHYVFLKNTPVASRYAKSGLYAAGSGKPLSSDLPPLLADGAWHAVRLVKQGDRATLWVDGEEKLSVKDPSLARCGHVGVGSWNDAASFDDVVVRSLAAP